MGLKTGLSIALIAAVLMAALAAGCGGGSSSSSGSTSSADSTSSSSTTGASAEFTGAGPNGKIVKFGQEADTAEREAASSVLEENLKAREAGDWAKQCTSLSAGAIKKLEQEAVRLKAGEKCAESLEYGAEPQSATKAIRANTMTGPIAVLRVEGNKAFALYHGTKGKDYAMQMEKEGGEWKVASLITTELH